MAARGVLAPVRARLTPASGCCLIDVAAADASGTVGDRTRRSDALREPAVRIAAVSASLDFDPTIGLFARSEPWAPPLVITGADADAASLARVAEFAEIVTVPSTGDPDRRGAVDPAIIDGRVVGVIDDGVCDHVAFVLEPDADDPAPEGTGPLRFSMVADLHAGHDA